MSWINEHIASFGERPAIVDDNEEITYQQLTDMSNCYMNEIEPDIQVGQVVVLHSDYNIYSIALFLALLEKKCIVVPIVTSNKTELNKRLKVVDCDWIIELTGSEVSLREKDSKEKHPLVQRLIESKNAGLILFSSGSTGEPKAMIHNLDNLVDSFKGKKPKKLNMLVFLMFDHIGGLNTLLNTLSMGAKIVLPKNRNPDYIASLIEKNKVHVLPSTPTFLNMMLIAKVKRKYNLTSLKMITYGTEPMPASLLQKLRLEFPKTRLMQTFGTSETGIAQTSSKSSDSLEMKLDNNDLEYKIIKGELWLKSKTQVLGYLNASMDCFTDDGWFQTGDLVEELDGGFIRIIGRNKEVINVGGEKVLPSEVESVVLEVEGVADCMAFGEKNAITGQMVAVQVVLHSEIEESLAKRNIRKHCRDKLETYKVPAKFKFVDKTNFGDRFKKMRLN